MNENILKEIEFFKDRIKKYNEHHYQIKGKIFCINFYPFVKKPTYYINGSEKIDKNSQIFPSIKFLIELSDGVQDAKNLTQKKAKRNKNSTRNFKKIKFKQNSVQECFYCKKSIVFENSNIDHKIPLSKGGSNRRDNLVLSCIECNDKKKNNLKVN